MSKFKRDVALFEVLAKEEAKGIDPLKVPAWWGRRRKKPQQAVQERPAAPRQPPEAQPAAPRDVPDAERQQFLEVQGDRIRVSLTSVTAAVVVFVALAVTLGAFELGQRVGHRSGFRQGAAAGRAAYEAEALSEIEMARRQPPAHEVVSDLLAETDAMAPLQSEPRPERGSSLQAPADAVAAQGRPVRDRAGWVQDFTYVVAQEFSRGRKDDAIQAQAFLSQHGVETELVEYRSGSIQLITLQGFNREDPVQRKMADELLDKVRTIGAKYFASGGRYKLEGYFKTLKDNTWVDEG